ncbi:MAG TPA: hypothetical protein DEA08_11160 [Planctomycetes bacterium]|nr:hypothetical protein [Planctomycetota bacterium]
MTAELTVLTPREEFSLTLTGDFVLGSRPDADLVLAEPAAPSHLVISPTRRGALLIQLEELAALPLQINGRPARKPVRNLRHGDRVEVGEVEVTYLGAGPRFAQVNPALTRSRDGAWQPPSDQLARALYQLGLLTATASSESALREGALQLGQEACGAARAALRQAGSWGACAGLGAPSALAETAADEALCEDELSERRGQRGGALAAPLRTPGRPGGVALVLDGLPPEGFELARALLPLLAHQLAAGLERVRLLKELQGERQRQSQTRARFQAALATIGEGLVLLPPRGEPRPLNERGADLAAALAASDPGLPRLAAELLASGSERAERTLTGQGRVVEVTLSRAPALEAAVAVLRDVTASREREAAHRRAEEALQREVLEVSSREQRRFGQDVHDDLCQLLGALALSAKRLEKRLAAREDPDAPLAAELRSELNQTTAQAYGLARGLCPVALEREGLPAALRDLIEASGRRYPELRFRYEGPAALARRLEPGAAHELYRIAQEALANAAKHSRAAEVVLGLEPSEGALELWVRDDGVGLDPNARPGMGSQIMAYRARALGAELVRRALPAGGTEVGCRWPCESETCP